MLIMLIIKINVTGFDLETSVTMTKFKSRTESWHDWEVSRGELFSCNKLFETFSLSKLIYQVA